MQVQESKPDKQVCSTGRKCTVCDHPEVDRINALLANRSVSKRGVAVQFDLSPTAVMRHAQLHLAPRLSKALERRADKQADVFMERHEHLFGEALKYIEDAKGAVKMQRVTVDTDAGPQERYQAFRDVGAMAPALTAATALQRVLGDATGRFAQAPAGAGVHVNLQVVIPRAIGETAGGQVEPAIDVELLPSSDPD